MNDIMLYLDLIMKQNDTNFYLKGIIYALITALLWGFLAILLKITVEKIPPITIVWFRFFIAFIFLALYLLFKNPNELSILLKPKLPIVLPALFLCLNYMGFMFGIYFTTPNNAQIFIQLGPVILAISGFIIFKERITIKQIIGFIIVIIGFICFYSQQISLFKEGPAIYNKGVLFVIAGAVMWAAYAISQKRSLKYYSTNQLNLFNFGLPILLIIPFVKFKIIAQLPTEYLILLFFLGINTLIAYTCISLALKYAEANKVSVIVTCNPIITFITMAILGYLEVSYINAENMNTLSIFGAGLVILGAILVVMIKKKN